MSRSSDFSGLSGLSQPDRNSRRVREREVLRVSAILQAEGATQAEGAADIAKREVLKWAEARIGAPLPGEAWKFRDFQFPVAGRECAAVRIVKDREDIWAIRTSDPDKNVAQRTWAAEIVIGCYDKIFFSLRLLMSSHEQNPCVEPAVPGLLRQLINSGIGLTQGTETVGDEPSTVESKRCAELLIRDLLDPKRKIPHVVLTVPADENNSNDPLLDARFLARVTVGIAKVIVVPARYTWILTNYLGKRLSVYNGAVRVYLPGFSEGANPYNHKLFFVEQDGSDSARNVTGDLQRMIARASLRQFRLDGEVLAYRTVRDRYHELNQKKLGGTATDQDQLAAARKQIDSLKENLESTKEESDWYVEQHGIVESEVTELKRRLHTEKIRNQELTKQLRSVGGKPDSNIDLPAEWQQFSDWCDEHFDGRVAILGAARKEIKSAKFERVSLAAECVIWLANDYRENRLHGSGDRPKIDMDGVHNARCGSDEFKVDWQGKKYKVDWHVKTGGNTRDPLRCLRIYYFWHEESQQVVIASMPAHRRTDAT